MEQCLHKLLSSLYAPRQGSRKASLMGGYKSELTETIKTVTIQILI
ncbi:hypothetical protein ACQ27_gp268 [Klebsiella phage K64-1]|nr:hypothetical protein ACQ27_gp268 [Klebsiella phage K64-1]